MQFDNVTLVCKANVYFGGKVISYTFIMPDGKTRKTIGVIFPGTFDFTTGYPENMLITAGRLHVSIPSLSVGSVYVAGQDFNVPSNTTFQVTCLDGPVEYVCTYKQG